jgi:hypothetical protein
VGTAHWSAQEEAVGIIARHRLAHPVLQLQDAYLLSPHESISRCAQSIAPVTLTIRTRDIVHVAGLHVLMGNAYVIQHIRRKATVPSPKLNWADDRFAMQFSRPLGDGHRPSKPRSRPWGRRAILWEKVIEFMCNSLSWRCVESSPRR